MASSASQQLYSLWIINKAGGLIYLKDLSPSSKLTTNDALRLASTFHSLHAITAHGLQVTNLGGKKKAKSGMVDALPSNQGGMHSLEARDFRLQCYQTLTGLKFLLVASPTWNQQTLDRILSHVYLHYCDLVLKNPFYELEMPIRIESFDTAVAKLMQQAMVAEERAASARERRER